MREWIKNRVNEICYLENKDNYVSLNISLYETALRLKIDTDYKTFIVMGNYKNKINNLESDLDILNWFLEETDGEWSNNIDILEKYINDNFIKQRKK